MSPVVRICPRCREIFNPAVTPMREYLCPPCYQRKVAQRNRQKITSGRTTARWKNLRLEAIRQADNRCARCRIQLPAEKLQAHLRPELRADHRQATLADITVLCPACHGQIDGPRAGRAVF